LPWYFIINLGLFAAALVTGFMKHLPKYRERITALSKDEQERAVKIWLKIIRLYKIFLILMPLYLGLLPYLLYIYTPQDFIYLTILLILVYLFIIEDYMFRKVLIKEMQERKTEELHSGSQTI
jgi:hypothetical protein